MYQCSESASRSVSQRHGSVDPDPDQHQNVMDPPDPAENINVGGKRGGGGDN
jgi:hypothetical protein